jgi:lipopolysaccharide/colanic/teichoic acid biosynthesis glycosyltransferase
MSTANPEIGEVATRSPGWSGSIEADYLEIDEVATMYSARNEFYEWIKPALDFALAIVMLVFTTPVMLVFMVLMRLSSRGHWIYAQKRLGLRGKVFTMYKIRTMYEDSEWDSIPRWCVPGDPRVTPLGRFLRYTHIDELPQLINVLKGEMSLVGPRPERPEFVEQLERALPNYRQRMAVRPGLTGLAQVQQPSDTDLYSVHRKLSYDLCYGERMSLWLDVRLLAGTVLKCVGVPFVWIGRILQLPDPNAQPGCKSLLTNPS